MVNLCSVARALVIDAGLGAGIPDGAQNFTNNELLEKFSFTHRIKTGGKTAIQRVGDLVVISIPCR
jgi:hypothetical protein